MATTTWTCNKDARIADFGGTHLGAGAGDWLPTGKYGGYQFRSLLGFAYSWTGMVSITSAVLHIKTSTQYTVAFGSSPQVHISRVVDAWSEGTTNTPMSTTNAVVYPGPTGTSTNSVVMNPGTAENTWVTADITAIVNDVFGGTWNGIRLDGWNGSAESTSSTDVSEFYAREYGSNDAYITVTYTTNTAPTAPTLSLPTNAAVAQSLTPSIKFLHNDPQADAILNYDLQVSTDSTFASVTHWNISAQTTGNNTPSTGYVTRTYAGSALANNTVYYWRARTKDPGGLQGPWSSAFHFTTAKLPTATLTQPTTDATKLAKLTFTAGSGWASPRLNVAWTFACGDSGTQSSYQVYIEEATTSAGTYTLWHDTGTVSSTATSLVDATTVINGRFYKVKVRVTCSHGQTSAYTATVRANASWSVVLTRVDLTTAPTVSWTVGTITTTLPSSSTSVVMEYGSNSTSSTPGTFYSAMTSVALNRYWFLRTYLLGYGTSPVTFPSLDNFTLTYTSLAQVPDHWVRSAPTTQTIDAAAVPPGQKSLKITGDGTTQAASLLVEVRPHTDYILSAEMKCTGNAIAALCISTGPVTGAIVSQTAGSGEGFTATTDWTRAYTGVWNSGSATSIYVTCRMSAGLAGTYTWFDDVKLEASTVATPFSPASSTDFSSVDGGGVQIDASLGGVLRLRGSTGGARDTVDLSAKGLMVGGDTELFSDTADYLTIDSPGSSTGIRLSNSGTTHGVIRASTSSNIVINPTSSGATYLSYDSGTGGVTFGDGASASAGSWSAAGVIKPKSGAYTTIRGMIAIPFTFTSLPGTGTVDGFLGDSAAGVVQARVPFKCEVVAISVALSTVRTAGTCTFQVYNASTAALVGMTTVIDGTTTNNKTSTATMTGTLDIDALQLFRLRATGASYTPTASTGSGIVYLSVYAE